MMFGYKDKFEYQQCSNCGCLQIAELPLNIHKYYPSHYYSFTATTAALKKQPLIKKIFSQIRLKKLMNSARPALKYLKPINVKFNDKILEIGCGKGQLICDLFNLGFENIEGVDKFIPHEINHGYGVKIMKKELSELNGHGYDLILMNHVLEHMDQQQEVLKQCYRLLKDKGCLMISIPILGAAWDIYKENWVQLDAPRHFFLHTLKSLAILAKDCGFEIRHELFDSISFQFWASELYKRNIPLFSEENNFKAFPIGTLFTQQELSNFEKESTRLNNIGKGDTAAFYLYKST